MFKGWWRQIPNVISSARLAATPVLLYAAIERQAGLFRWLLLACLASDILDGLVARIFHLRSELGARLDSIADMIVFLSSDRAAHVTGQTINVDGGFVMHW